MARHPWVAKADAGVRFGVQVAAMRRRTTQLDVTLHDDPLGVLMDAGRLIDSLGYDGLFLHDHPSFSPDPWIGLAALAVATERVTLGSVVVCEPYRHPTLVARMATDIDNLSRGRFMLGLGIGWAVPEFAALGKSFDSVKVRQAQLVETVEIVKGLWTGEPFSYHGKHYAIEDVRIDPRPIQQPAPPLMIAGGGEQVTLRQVAHYADACNFGDLFQPEDPFSRDLREGTAQIRSRLEVLRRHCETEGRPYDEILRTHFVSWLMVAPTEAEARDKFRSYFGDEMPPTARGVVLGTPEQITEYYQARADAGMQYFIYQLLDGKDHETIRLMAEQVMPNVRS
jgi:alkanesulfonate monooxygenase SsuD/methylene tetrahydromethanopterin reductase-like flavin-dependent oxidoreductase (luciferase family)